MVLRGPSWKKKGVLPCPSWTDQIMILQISVQTNVNEAWHSSRRLALNWTRLWLRHEVMILLYAISLPNPLTGFTIYHFCANLFCNQHRNPDSYRFSTHLPTSSQRTQEEIRTCKRQGFSRRDFLSLAGATGGAALLAACQAVATGYRWRRNGGRHGAGDRLGPVRLANRQ